MPTTQFEMGKKMGDWAENTLIKYFRENHQKIGFDIFYYGSKVRTRKKDTSDAPNRPDFIVIRNKNIRNLLKEGIDLYKLDLTKILSDKDDKLQKIVQKAHCAIEVKSSMRFFKQDLFDRDSYNFIIDAKMKEKFESWQKKIPKKLKIFVIWLFFDRAYIASIDQIFKEGEVKGRTYNRRGFTADQTLTYNLPFRKASFFAKVEGIVPYRTLKPVLDFQESGYIALYPKIKVGKLSNVNLDIIKKPY